MWIYVAVHKSLKSPYSLTSSSANEILYITNTHLQTPTDHISRAQPNTWLHEQEMDRVIVTILCIVWLAKFHETS